jgi:diketogulonate reductase-like aldo/keto reductase
MLYAVTGAQVSLRWLYEHGVPFSTKSTSSTHLAENLAIDGWDSPLNATEKQELDNAKAPFGIVSYMCLR